MSGVRGRLLILAALFVLFAEALIYPPLAAIYVDGWLSGRAQAAQIAALAIKAAPDGPVSDELSLELLAQAQVISVAVQGVDTRELILPPSTPIDGPLVRTDIRKDRGFAAIPDAVAHIFAPKGRYLQIILIPGMTHDAEMEVIVPESALKQGLAVFSRTLLLATATIALVVGGLAYFAIYRLVVRPMRGLTNSVVRFAEQPEAEQISFKPGGSDEMQRAALALQTMQRTVAALSQRKRLAELGEAVAKINHDLRNSLAAAQIVSEGLAQSEDPRVKRALPRLERAIERAVALAESTLNYGKAKPVAPTLAPVNVIPAIEEAAQEGLAGAPQIEWKLDAPGQLVAQADPDHVHRIIANIVRNAARAIADQPGRDCPGKVTARAFRENGHAIVEIEDNGPGLSDKAQQKLFQPFASSSKDGAGLGLAIARELARGMKGELELARSGAGGAAFKLRIPAA